MAGTLYLCATPIGNLEDMTYRAVRILKEVDLIAAEDTRNSIKLLNHFEIKTPMTSYHEYNKVDKARYLVGQLQQGMDIALVTDAGTPGISDPGEELVKFCHEAGIEVTSLPGPAACITALTISGLPTRRFAFEAFLPADKKERRTILEELKNETRTIILYEAPHRLTKTLGELLESLGDRRMTLCRELTKKHETAFQTTISGLIEYYSQEKPLGECVLVIKGRSRQDIQFAWRQGQGKTASQHGQTLYDLLRDRRLCGQFLWIVTHQHLAADHLRTGEILRRGVAAPALTPESSRTGGTDTPGQNVRHLQGATQVESHPRREYCRRLQRSRPIRTNHRPHQRQRSPAGKEDCLHRRTDSPSPRHARSTDSGSVLIG